MSQSALVLSAFCLYLHSARFCDAFVRYDTRLIVMVYAVRQASPCLVRVLLLCNCRPRRHVIDLLVRTSAFLTAHCLCFTHGRSRRVCVTDMLYCVANVDFVRQQSTSLSASACIKENINGIRYAKTKKNCVWRCYSQPAMIGPCSCSIHSTQDRMDGPGPDSNSSGRMICFFLIKTLSYSSIISCQNRIFCSSIHENQVDFLWTRMQTAMIANDAAEGLRSSKMCQQVRRE